MSYTALRTTMAALLGTTAVALAYVNSEVITSEIDTSPMIVTGTTTYAVASGGSALQMPEPPQSLSETTARPVFFADRKPIAPKAEVAAAPEAQPDLSPGSLQLLGTVRFGKGKVKALIRTGEANSGRWIPVGDEIQGWQVREVSGDAAVIEANGRRVELKISYAGGAAPVPGQMPPPGPGLLPPPPPPPPGP